MQSAMLAPRPSRKKLIVRTFTTRSTSAAPLRSSTLAAPIAPVAPPVPCVADAAVADAYNTRDCRRKAELAAARAWLRTSFSVAFGFPVLPLAVGVGKDIEARAAAAGLKRSAIKAALRYRTSSRAYIEAVAAEGATRFDLDGQAVETVSGEHQAHARASIAAMAAARPARRSPARG